MKYGNYRLMSSKFIDFYSGLCRENDTKVEPSVHIFTKLVDTQIER